MFENIWPDSKQKEPIDSRLDRNDGGKIMCENAITLLVILNKH